MHQLAIRMHKNTNILENAYTESIQNLPANLLLPIPKYLIPIKLPIQVGIVPKEENDEITITQDI